MDHMLRRDYVSVIVLIVFLGKFHRCLQGISYLMCMNVMVQGITTYENGIEFNYALPRRVVQRSSALLVL